MGLLTKNMFHQNWSLLYLLFCPVRPPPLYLQDVKPLSSIPLLGCSVEDSPQELWGQPCFCVRQPRTTHTFSCDGLDLKQSWLTVLKAAATGKHHDTNGSRWHITGSFSDASVCPGEEFLIIGDNEKNSWMFEIERDRKYTNTQRRTKVGSVEINF